MLISLVYLYNSWFLKWRKEFACPLASTDRWETFWTKCCLCQEGTTDLLQLSADGWTIMSNHIPLFHDVTALPIHQDIRRLKRQTGIESTMKKNNNKYQNLDRITIQKLVELRNAIWHQCHLEVRVNGSPGTFLKVLFVRKTATRYHWKCESMFLFR